MEEKEKTEPDNLFEDPVSKRCKGEHEPVSIINLKRLKDSYQGDIQFLERAKNYEADGKEELAIDAYFQTGRLAEDLKRDWEWGIKNRRYNLERELEALEEFSIILSPSSSDIENLFSQINNGLNGRMKMLYESEERKLWESKKAEERSEEFQHNYYLLQRDLNPDETAQVIDELREIDWLVLKYKRDFSLSLEQREKLDELFTAQKLTLEKQIMTYLTQSLSLPQEMVRSHDIDVCIRPYDYVSDLSGKSLDEIKDRERISIELNFLGKAGSDIVNFGFSSVNGYDPDIVYITPYTLVNIKRIERGYYLEIFNPQYKGWLPIGIVSEPELAKRAAQRAGEILIKLTR